MDSSFGSYPRFPIAAAHFVRQDLRAGQTVSVSRHAGMGHRHGLGTPERLSVKHNHRLGTREDMGEQRTSKPWIYELPSLRVHMGVRLMFTLCSPFLTYLSSHASTHAGLTYPRRVGPWVRLTGRQATTLSALWRALATSP